MYIYRDRKWNIRQSGGFVLHLVECEPLLIARSADHPERIRLQLLEAGRATKMRADA
ncbi:MAG: hypothetical protein R3C20_05190 [Planctomycetaceae bacterium]